MSARILDGKALSDSVRAEVAREVEQLKAEHGVTPGLAVALVGADPASSVYVRNKRNACKKAGMTSFFQPLPAETTEDELLRVIDGWNTDPAVHGILVQLPLPRHIRDDRVIAAIDPRKDVDGFHPENVGLLTTGRPRFVPCTPLGIQAMLVRSGIETRGARAVVLGRSNIVGKPMALLLLRKGPGGDATVTVAHTGTADPASIAREADILIVAMGQPERVNADWVKPGAVVIDVGIHRRDDDSLCGDVHFPSVSEVASWISPVPGGVGRMTVAMLLQNTLQAARLAAKS